MNKLSDLLRITQLSRNLNSGFPESRSSALSTALPSYYYLQRQAESEKRDIRTNDTLKTSLLWIVTVMGRVQDQQFLVESRHLTI